MPDQQDEYVPAARIPADIARPDTLLGPLTARQTAILAVTGLFLYGGYWATRTLMHPLAYAALVAPAALAVTVAALGRRDGIGLDRYLLNGVAHARTPKRRVHAPEGVPPLPDALHPRLAAAVGPPPAVMRMPYEGVSEAGVLDLGRDGQAALATCSSVNFDLRSGAEQQGLTAGFARWLNSLTGPTQLLVRCHRIDLGPYADQLHHDAPALPHPALEEAARAHADFLADLAAGQDLRGRQIVLVARQPAPPRGVRAGSGGERAVQRLHEAVRALAPAEITVTALDVRRTAALVSAACNPDAPTQAGLDEGDAA